MHGSTDTTSAAKPASLPDRSASTTACSSTSVPRAVFRRYAPSFMRRWSGRSSCGRFRAWPVRAGSPHPKRPAARRGSLGARHRFPVGVLPIDSRTPRHAESTRDAAYCLPDASHADDAHRLACQLHERRVPEREVLGARPVAFHDQIGMLSYMQAQLQQQRERHLRHVGRGVGPGTVRYDHARIAAPRRDPPRCSRWR